VFRRTYTADGGKLDEAFTKDLVWRFSPSLVSAERGDLQNEFIEITEDEANQIVERIRTEVTGSKHKQQLSPLAPTVARKAYLSAACTALPEGAPLLHGGCGNVRILFRRLPQPP
jgi:hypothetical protein